MNDFDPHLAVEYGSLIKVSYGMFAAADAPFTPPAPMPAGFEFVARIIMTDSFRKKEYPEVYGLIAKRTTKPNTFVLAIRGTDDRVEWWEDLKAAIAIPVSGLGRIGDGFENIFKTMQVIGADGKPTTQYGSADFTEQVAATVKNHTPSGKLLSETTEDDPAVFQIEVIGHSLGSALATLYVARNANSKKVQTPILYTFASPRVGNWAFVRFVNKLGINSWRIENPSDAVPGLPPIPFFFHVNNNERVLSLPPVWDGVFCHHDYNTYLYLLTRKYSITPIWPLSSDCVDNNPPDPSHITGH